MCGVNPVHPVGTRDVARPRHFHLHLLLLVCALIECHHDLDVSQDKHCLLEYRICCLTKHYLQLGKISCFWPGSASTPPARPDFGRSDNEESYGVLRIYLRR
ncbi:hypothetical protein BDV18DRAFT_41243 [Aspergillus unguis]